LLARLLLDRLTTAAPWDRQGATGLATSLASRIIAGSSPPLDFNNPRLTSRIFDAMPTPALTGRSRPGPAGRRKAMMSTETNKQRISELVDEVWNQRNPAAIDYYFGPGVREEVAEHYRQLLTGFPDLQVTIDGDLIAEADLVVARLTLMGTHTGPFAGQPGTGHPVGWSSIRIYRVADGKVVQTWAMQDRLGLLQQLGAIPELQAVSWAGSGTSGNRAGSP
jgi:predicted ester cyclase